MFQHSFYPTYCDFKKMFKDILAISVIIICNYSNQTLYKFINPYLNLQSKQLIEKKILNYPIHIKLFYVYSITPLQLNNNFEPNV